jgi:hypothetical protein
LSLLQFLDKLKPFPCSVTLPELELKPAVKSIIDSELPNLLGTSFTSLHQYNASFKTQYASKSLLHFLAHHEVNAILSSNSADAKLEAAKALVALDFGKNLNQGGLFEEKVVLSHVLEAIEALRSNYRLGLGGDEGGAFGGLLADFLSKCKTAFPLALFE